MQTEGLTRGQREWQKEKARLARDPAYRAKYKGRQAKCVRNWKRANPDKVKAAKQRERERARARDREALSKGQYVVIGPRAQSIRGRAKERGLPFALAGMSLPVPPHCPLSGIPLDGRDLNHRPSIDRINNQLGYVPGNIWIVSHWANGRKGTADIPTALRRIRRAKRRQAKRTLH
jgi:hypothetical protein